MPIHQTMTGAAWQRVDQTRSKLVESTMGMGLWGNSDTPLPHGILQSVGVPT